MRLKHSECKGAAELAALVAIERTLLAIWTMLTTGAMYGEPGQD